MPTFDFFKMSAETTIPRIELIAAIDDLTINDAQVAAINNADKDGDEKLLLLYRSRWHRLSLEAVKNIKSDYDAATAYHQAPKKSLARDLAIKKWYELQRTTIKQAVRADDVASVMFSDTAIHLGSTRTMSVEKRHIPLVKKIQAAAVAKWRILKLAEIEEAGSVAKIVNMLSCQKDQEVSSANPKIAKLVRKIKAKALIRGIDLVKSLADIEMLINIADRYEFHRIRQLASQKRDEFYLALLDKADTKAKIIKLYYTQLKCGSATAIDSLRKLANFYQLP